MILTHHQGKNWSGLWSFCLYCVRKSSICPPGTGSSIRLVGLGATSRCDGLLGAAATAIKRQTAAPTVPALFSPWAHRCPPEVVLPFSLGSRCGENFKFRAASSRGRNHGYPHYTIPRASRKCFEIEEPLLYMSRQESRHWLLSDQWTVLI